MRLHWWEEKDHLLFASDINIDWYGLDPQTKSLSTPLGGIPSPYPTSTTEYKRQCVIGLRAQRLFSFILIAVAFQSAIQTERTDNGHIGLGFGVVSGWIHCVQSATGVPGHLWRLHDSDANVSDPTIRQHRGQRVRHHVLNALRVQHAHVRRHGHHTHHSVFSVRFANTHVANVLHNRRVSHDRRTGT